MAAREKSNAKSKTGRGGKRPGAGRPSEPAGPAGIKWALVRKFARLGADRDTIVAALGIPADVLRQPEVLARMQEELQRGEALHRLDLLADVRRLRIGGPGKVNAVLASLKHKLGWNKPDSGKGKDEQRPDNAAAVAEVARMLGRFNAPR